LEFFYIYNMNTANLSQEILLFFESITKYYGSKTEITVGLCTDVDSLDANLTTWNLSEFELVRSAYRKSGGKFMLEGNGTYFEVSAERIINFKKLGRNQFEFIECYSKMVYRITKIRFHYKY